MRIIGTQKFKGQPCFPLLQRIYKLVKIDPDTLLEKKKEKNKKISFELLRLLPLFSLLNPINLGGSTTVFSSAKQSFQLSA